jgi:hypothetical protein
MTTIKEERKRKIDYRKKFKHSSLGPALCTDSIQRAAKILFYLAFI